MSKKKTKVVEAEEVITPQEIASSLVKINATDKGLAAKPPEWIAKIEDTGTAMMQAGQEFLLVIEDALMRYHGFSEDDLKQLHKEILPVLQGVKEFERHGLTMLSPHDVGIVGEMNEYGELGEVLGELSGVRQQKLRAERADIEIPILPGAAPFIRKLKKKNND